MKPTAEQQAIIHAATQPQSLMVNALAGTGKALKNNQRVVTPTGYKPIGELKIGDKVAGTDGLFYPVIGVFPQGVKDLYELTFSDKSKVIASGDHIWTMRRADKKIRDVTTEQLFAKPKQDNGRSYWFLPRTKAVDFPKKKLPINPWMLGILLGDGCLQEHSVSFSSADESVVTTMTLIAQADFLLFCKKTSEEGYDYRLTNRANLGKSNELLERLRDLGLAGKKSEDKFIPREYLIADINARIGLLQGLLDSDGSASNGAIDYSTSSEALAYDVKFLVESLGGTATISSRQTTHKLSHRLYIKMTQHPFTILRKLKNYYPKLMPYRSLQSVKKVEAGECTCISVGSDDKLFLTENFIPTHNTTTLTMLAKALPAQPALALAFNKKIKEELEKRFPSNFTVMTMNGLGHRAWSFTINKKKMLIDANKLGRLTSEALKPFPDSKGEWASIRTLVVMAMQRGLVPSQFQHAKSLLPDTPDTWEALDYELDLNLTPNERKLARRILIESIEEGFKGCISYDDQIYLPVVFAGAFPRFPTVLVDEAQDLSPLNHQMLKKVAAGKLIVVGDPRQAIYAFRGADHHSMENLKSLKPEWIELPLNTTFRCPQSIVDRQHKHAPAYRAAESNPQGKILDFEGGWNWQKVMDVSTGDVAILCRNNAPLLTMAFRLLRQGIGVNMMGRDIGRGLSALCKKLSPDQTLFISTFRTKLADWFETEKSKAEANQDGSKVDSVTDKYECILAVIENKNPTTVRALIVELDNLFAKDSGLVTLATGHKAKGLEWGTVVHLDPWRIPSKWAKKPDEITQEYNLQYVLETRTKHTLILANLADFT